MEMSKNGENVLPTQSCGNGRTWELSLYDQHRTPHDPVTDQTEITVSPRSLNAELMCPICLDMLKNTMTTKDCLHRFCQECITTALRNGNKECPTCRKKLVSRRALRPDPNFDELIKKLYPNRAEYEAMQERALARLAKHSNASALQKSIEEGMRLQAQLRKMHRNSNASTSHEDSSNNKRVKKRKRDDSSRRATPDRDSSVGDLSASEASTQVSSRSRALEVELILKPHPNTESTSPLCTVIKQTRYLKTTANATIDHLSRYLAMRIKLDSDEASRNNLDASLDAFQKLSHYTSSLTSAAATADEDKQTRSPTSDKKSGKEGAKAASDELGFDIYVDQTGTSRGSVLLPGHISLETVVNRYWKVKRPLELLFLTRGSPACDISANGHPESRTMSNDENKRPSGGKPTSNSTTG